VQTRYYQRWQIAHTHDASRKVSHGSAQQINNTTRGLSDTEKQP
jgi:hypothetical protein